MSTTVEVMVAVALKVVDPAASMSFSRRVGDGRKRLLFIVDHAIRAPEREKNGGCTCVCKRREKRCVHNSSDNDSMKLVR